jgi:uncharacterized DUF497 family protein
VDEELQFDWDPVKDESNQAKHGIAFLGAARVFDDPHRIVSNSTRPEFEEIRMKAIGIVEDKMIAVIYTDRGSTRRIISARKARDNERREYRESQASREGSL